MYMRASSFIPKTMRESAERVGFGHETSELGLVSFPSPTLCTLRQKAIKKMCC